MVYDAYRWQISSGLKCFQIYEALHNLHCSCVSVHISEARTEKLMYQSFFHDFITCSWNVLLLNWPKQEISKWSLKLGQKYYTLLLNAQYHGHDPHASITWAGAHLVENNDWWCAPYTSRQGKMSSSITETVLIYGCQTLYQLQKSFGSSDLQCYLNRIAFRHFSLCLHNFHIWHWFFIFYFWNGDCELCR